MEYTHKQIKAYENAIKTLKKINDFKNTHGIKNTQCFLTELPKNYSYKEKTKIKIDYFNENWYGIVLSSANWMNSLTKEKIEFEIAPTKEWKKKLFKKAPIFLCHGNFGFLVPKEIVLALQECFNSLMLAMPDIEENLEKNFLKFVKTTSMKNFGVSNG